MRETSTEKKYNSSSQALGELFGGEFLVTLHFMNRRSELFRNVLGRLQISLWESLCYCKTSQVMEKVQGATRLGATGLRTCEREICL